ncbi:hypothetical protein NPIL_109331 [Nephila pilipes]|uniref:Uncharacterized protein n=1 Tax=Nephila pilipes TaxID=299642 RepID=A0A8X6NWT7_NEPPI|nr:hypothetical protein NPIL_109331 [Nephila pilipes]
MIVRYHFLLVVFLFCAAKEILAAGELCGFGRCQIYECCRGVLIFGYCQRLPMPGESCKRSVANMIDADCYTCAPKFKCVNEKCSLSPFEDDV